MATVNLNLSDLGYGVMYPEFARVIWHLSDTAVTDTGGIVSNRPEAFTPDASGNVSCRVVDTESMMDDQYYTITIDYLDPVGGLPGLETPPWQIRVPPGTWKLSDLIENYSQPLITWVGTSYPDPLTAFWLNPVTGDFYGLDR